MQKEVAPLQGKGPNFGGPFTQVMRGRAHRPRPAPPRPTRRGEASERARVFFLPPIHTLARDARATNLISWTPSTSTSNVGLNLCTPTTHEWAFEIFQELL